MPQDPMEQLSPATATDSLISVALRNAKGSDPKGHAALLDQLRKPDFLARLDSAAEYSDDESVLRVGRVLDALGENSESSARQVLIGLTGEGVFAQKTRRVVLLIGACANVRPSPPEIVAFWDKHFRPSESYTAPIVTAILHNQSNQALRLLEKKMSDPVHENDSKIDWMRFFIICHRNDLPVLQACERILKGKMSAQLKPALAEILFDYRPQEWYDKHGGVQPPDRSAAGSAAKDELRKIGRHALDKIELTDQQKQAVENTLSELG